MLGGAPPSKGYVGEVTYVTRQARACHVASSADSRSVQARGMPAARLPRTLGRAAAGSEVPVWIEPWVPGVLVPQHT